MEEVTAQAKNQFYRRTCDPDDCAYRAVVEIEILGCISR